MAVIFGHGMPKKTLVKPWIILKLVEEHKWNDFVRHTKEKPDTNYM
jgi:hypothetical protein